MKKIKKNYLELAINVNIDYAIIEIQYLKSEQAPEVNVSFSK